MPGDLRQPCWSSFSLYRSERLGNDVEDEVNEINSRQPMYLVDLEPLRCVGRSFVELGSENPVELDRLKGNVDVAVRMDRPSARLDSLNAAVG